MANIDFIARGLAAQKTPTIRPITIAQLGDSRTAQGYPNALTSSINGWQYWTEVFSNGCVRMPQTLNYGVSGDTTTQVLARLPAAVASNSSAVIVFASINDRSASMTAAQSIANLSTMVSAVLAAGKIAILVAESPRGDTTYTSLGFSGAVLANHIQVHRWCLAQAGRANVAVVNCWPFVADPASANGYAILGKTYDGQHFSISGAIDVASKMWAAISRFFPPLDFQMDTAADVYSAANNPLGNLTPNGMLTGTGGTLSGGTTSGTLASSTTASLPTGITGTFTANALYLGKTWQKIVLSGTPTAAGDIVITQYPAVANFAAGDNLEAMYEWAVEAGSSNHLPLKMRFGFNFPVAGVLYNYSGTGPANTQYGYLPSNAYQGVVRSPQWAITETPTSTEYSVLASVVANVAVSATFYIRALSLRKV